MEGTRTQVNGTELRKQAWPRRPRPRPHATGAWLFGALIPLAACGDNGETTPNPAQVTDSAGITIVASPPSDRSYATLTPEPVLSVGVLEGPEALMFGRIASAALDGAGNLVVADGQSDEIRVFDGSGNHLRTLGGTGEGPGEFRRLTGAWPTPDGIIVAVDNGLNRITRFGPDGELLGSHPFREFDGVRTDRLAGSDAVVSRVQSLSSTRPGSPESRVEQIVAGSLGLGGGDDHVIRHSLDGALIDTIATLPGRATVISSQDGGHRFSLRSVPLAPVPAIWSSGSGQIAVTAGSAYEISLYGPSGALQRIVRLAKEPPLRTDADLEAHVRGESDEPMDEAAVRSALRRFQDMKIPERLPAWDGLVIAADGQIWARRFSIRVAETHLFDVFGAEGGYLGTVAIPANLRIQHIADGRLVVIATDELGVQRVQVHELERT